MHGAGSARMDRVRFGSESGKGELGNGGVGKNKKGRWVSASLWRGRWENTNGSGALLCSQIWSVLARTIDHRYGMLKRQVKSENQSLEKKRKEKKGEKRGHREAESIEMPLRRHAFESSSLCWLRRWILLQVSGIIRPVKLQAKVEAKNWWHLHRRGGSYRYCFLTGSNGIICSAAAHKSKAKLRNIPSTDNTVSRLPYGDNYYSWRDYRYCKLWAKRAWICGMHSTAAAAKSIGCPKDR